MARPLRIEYEGAFYHVTARGNERKKFFFNKSDYKKFTSIGNKQLGGLFGGLSYSAVSKVKQRFAEKLKKDKRLRRRVENIIDSMSYVKG